MKKATPAAKAANAKDARAPRNATTTRLRRAYEEFYSNRAALTELAEAYPDALAAIEEYANSFLSEGRKGKARRHACRLANDTACLCPTWREYAADAIARLSVDGDLPGDAVPAEVVAGLVYLRHNAPGIFSRIVAMDAALGRVLPVGDGIFASSALLMRSALARAA